MIFQHIIGKNELKSFGIEFPAMATKWRSEVQVISYQVNPYTWAN